MTPAVAKPGAEPRGRKTILLSFILFALMVSVAVFSKEGFLTVFEFEKELARVRAGNEALAEENRALREDIRALKTDPYAVERIAREKLGLVKPGETVYQLVPLKGTDAPRRVSP